MKSDIFERPATYVWLHSIQDYKIWSPILVKINISCYYLIYFACSMQPLFVGCNRLFLPLASKIKTLSDNFVFTDLSHIHVLHKWNRRNNLFKKIGNDWRSYFFIKFNVWKWCQKFHNHLISLQCHNVVKTSFCC